MKEVVKMKLEKAEKQLEMALNEANVENYVYHDEDQVVAEITLESADTFVSVDFKATDFTDIEEILRSITWFLNSYTTKKEENVFYYDGSISGIKSNTEDIDLEGLTDIENILKKL